MTLLDISIYQGSSFNLSLTAVDSTGAMINLSGFSARGQVRYGFGSTGVLLNLNPQVDTGYVSGLINISLNASQTTGLPITKAVYDIEAYNSGNYCFKAFAGYANIYPEVTF